MRGQRWWSSYHDEVQRALQQRAHLARPPIRWPVAITGMVGVALYIVVAILIAPDGSPDHHFRSEEGIITALSAVLLAMAGGLAGTCGVLTARFAGGSPQFWYVAALGLLFCALDELLEFHEQFGVYISHTSVGPTQLFRNWNDVIVIGYGLLTIAVIVCYLPSILRYPTFAELLTLALVAYSIHTAVDSTQVVTSMSVMLEESAKLCSAALLAAAMFAGVCGAVAARRD